MQCPFCRSEDTFVFYRAEMPNLLAACPEDMLPRVTSRPFEATLCRICAFGFNSTPLSDVELKEIYDDYLYISPLRGIGRSKYVGMAETLRKTFKPADRIVEIGCSEGYLLSGLRDHGFTNMTGIEPAPQGATAAKLGFTVIKEYLRTGMFEPGSVDGFFLMHVFEHVPEPFGVLAEMKRALSPRGAIVIEVPHLEGFVHQHLWFFSMPFVRRMARELDLKIIGAVTDEFILRVVLVHAADPRPEQPPAGEATKEEIVERAQANYRQFEAQIARLNDIVRSCAGKTLYWWGAGSTGVVYLNQMDQALRRSTDIVVVDGDKTKWGCFVPGPKMRVGSFQGLQGRDIDCLIIASQFDREIRATLSAIDAVPKRVEVFAS